MSMIPLKLIIDAKAADLTAKAATSFKAAVDGGFERIIHGMKDIIMDTAKPALGILVGQLTSDTAAGRTALMTELVTLVQSETFKEGAHAFNTTINGFLIIVAELVKYMNELDALTNNLETTLGSVQIDAQAVHNLFNNGNELPNTGTSGEPTVPPNGEVTPGIGTIDTGTPHSHPWWDPWGLFERWY